MEEVPDKLIEQRDEEANERENVRKVFDMPRLVLVPCRYRGKRDHRVSARNMSTGAPSTPQVQVR